MPVMGQPNHIRETGGKRYAPYGMSRFLGHCIAAIPARRARLRSQSFAENLTT